MTTLNSELFVLPDIYLSELPTGAVKTAVDTVGRRIAHGGFAAGATLPMEAELMEILGVSRTVVRETIKVLSGKGMVRTARRYGTRVLPPEHWNLLDPDVIRWHDPQSPLAQRIFMDSTELRVMVEPQAAALAAMHATDAQVATILRAADHIQPDEHGLGTMIAADYTFHATILEASGNVMLRQLQGVILALLQFCYPAGQQAAPDKKVSRRAHIAVAEAIMARNPDEAQSRMFDMLSINRAVAEDMYQKAH